MHTAPADAHETSDEECMLALQQGDDAVLAKLMERWERPVKAFIFRLGVPMSDVDDVAQDAFVRLYQKRAAFRAGAAFKPWFLTIAGNLARNRRRWGFRHPAGSLEEHIEATGSEPGDEMAVSPAKLVEDSSRHAEVRKIVSDLPDPLREAVVCVELEDMSYAEAAKVMDCTEKAVETRLYRAKQALKQSLRFFIDGKK
jgi:RNA polymerase sigma-70 factor, ECF subfamily